MDKPKTTTVFVGNITEVATDTFIRQLLMVCIRVASLYIEESKLVSDIAITLFYVAFDWAFKGIINFEWCTIIYTSQCRNVAQLLVGKEFKEQLGNYNVRYYPVRKYIKINTKCSIYTIYLLCNTSMLSVM